MTCQDVLDKYGYIVIAYTDPEEFERDKKDRIIHGSTINWNGGEDTKVAVVADSTAEEWAAQCHDTGDPVHHWSEGPHVGFLRVVVE